MCTSVNEMRALLKWILELPAENQSENMSTVIKKRNIFCPADFCNLLYRFRKEEKAFAKNNHIRRSLLHQVNVFWYIKMISVFSCRPEMQ